MILVGKCGLFTVVIAFSVFLYDGIIGTAITSLPGFGMTATVDFPVESRLIQALPPVYERISVMITASLGFAIKGDCAWRCQDECALLDRLTHRIIVMSWKPAMHPGASRTILPPRRNDSSTPRHCPTQEKPPRLIRKHLIILDT